MQAEKTQIETLLDQTGLNWKVRTEPIITASNIILEDYVAIIREDTNVPLSVKSTAYCPYQNHELLELLEKVANKTGLSIHKGGYFGEGEKIYIQLKSDDLRLSGDKIEGYVTGINSFDGSTTLGFGNSTITISCMNTFFGAFRELASKIRHTKNMNYKIDEVCRTLELSLTEEKSIFKQIKRMSEVKIDSKVKDLVVKALFNIDSKLDVNSDKIATVTRKRMEQYYVDSAGEIREKGDNLWGLFSGVTKYTTHSINKENNTENKLFGMYGKRERMIFDSLAILVED